METSATRQDVADAYKLLEASPEQALKEVKKLYWHKSLAVHPHNHPNDPDAAAKLYTLTKAMDIIRDNHGKFSSRQLALGSSAEVSVGDVVEAWCDLACTIAEAPVRICESVLSYWWSYWLAA